MYTIEAFACGYCHRVMKLRSSVVRHEKSCFRDPKNKACKMCKNLLPRSEQEGLRICRVRVYQVCLTSHCEKHEPSSMSIEGVKL